MHSLLSSCLRVFVCLMSLLLIRTHMQQPLLAVEQDSLAGGGLHPQPVPVVMWNRAIVVFRAAYEELTPESRAKFATERMTLMPANLSDYRVAAVDVLENGRRVALIKVNGRIMFALVEGDEDRESGETFEQNKQRTVREVSSWFMARKEQYELPLLMQSAGISLLASIVSWLAFLVVTRPMRKLLRLLGSKSTASDRKFIFAGVNTTPYLISLSTGLLRIFEGVLTLTIAYLWLTYVLSQFPYTEPWSWQLSGFLLGLLSEFGRGILFSMPGIFTTGLIFFITRLLVNVISAFFKAAEEGSFDLPWFDHETAKATRRIVVVLVWIFALIIAYPLIPGSQTKVFQGVSVFLGLMLSLGSAGLVGQLIGGVVAVYTRAFQAGDYVRIGEHEGVVQELGLLAAKIVTVRKEEVTIPNALLMASTTVNYTRQAKTQGAIVSTDVTIGYDAPWRQVKAMLEMAAERTPGIRKSPGPVVLQKALSDFYVEYTLMSTIDRPEERYYILSDLHGHIQDVFNEYGVQIMSPNFRMQPEKDVVVPKEQWYAKPARERPADG